jgi:hypothetical protein
LIKETTVADLGKAPTKVHKVIKVGKKKKKKTLAYEVLGLLREVM